MKFQLFDSYFVKCLLLMALLSLSLTLTRPFSFSPPQTTLNVCHYGKVQLLIGLTDSHTSCGLEEYNASASVCHTQHRDISIRTAHWTLVIGWQRATKQLMCVRVLCGFFVFLSLTRSLSQSPNFVFFWFLNVTIFKWLSSRLYVSLLPNIHL